MSSSSHVDRACHVLTSPDRRPGAYRTWVAIAAAIVYVATVYSFDLYSPAGRAVGLLYVPGVWLVASYRSWVAVPMTAVCSLLVMQAAYAARWQPIAQDADVWNAVLAVVAIWGALLAQVWFQHE